MKIGIVEGVQADSALLEELLKQYFLCENIKADIDVYNSGDDFLAGWPLELDIVFLDIQIGGLNGIQVAAKIRESNVRVIIIFITNNPQYSLTGYSVEALDYLLKPITPELLEHLLPKVIRKLGYSDRVRLTIHNSDGYFVINLRDVNNIELENHKMVIHTKTDSISCQGTI
jgi:DNA-binding LytR/AlgR family response regulator